MILLLFLPLLSLSAIILNYKKKPKFASPCFLVYMFTFVPCGFLILQTSALNQCIFFTTNFITVVIFLCQTSSLDFIMSKRKRILETKLVLLKYTCEDCRFFIKEWNDSCEMRPYKDNLPDKNVCWRFYKK